MEANARHFQPSPVQGEGQLRKQQGGGKSSSLIKLPSRIPSIRISTRVPVGLIA